MAVEEIGWGWCVNTAFNPGHLNDPQKKVPLSDLAAAPASRVALHSPGIGHHRDTLSTTGVTATPAGPDWLGLTAPETSKAAALEAIRTHLNVPAEQTVAVGDGINDLEMLAWAARSVAMGHAPAAAPTGAPRSSMTAPLGSTCPWHTRDARAKPPHREPREHRCALRTPNPW